MSIQVKSIAGEPYINDKKMLYQEGATQLPSDGAWSYRNKLINGGFDIWQRATSKSNYAGYGTADRWYMNTHTSPGSFTISKGSDSVVGNYFTCNRTVEDGDHLTSKNYVQQRIENGKFLVANRIVTISFMMKMDIEVETQIRIRELGGSYTTLGDGVLQSLGTGWNKYSITYNLLSSATDHVELMIEVSTGAVNSRSIAQIQIEEGSIATPFEQRLIGYELDLCQRYYQKAYISGTTYMSSNSGAWLEYSPRVIMRAAPTIVNETTASEMNGGFQNISKNVIIHGAYHRYNDGTTGEKRGVYVDTLDAEL